MIRVYLICVFAIWFANCNSQSKSVEGTTATSTATTQQSVPPSRNAMKGGDLGKKLSFPFNTPKVKTKLEIMDLRKRFGEVIRERQMTMKEDLQELTYYFVTPRGFANLGKRMGPKHFVGMWAKFSDDYTYKYGLGPITMGTGVYHYAGSDQFLMMMDDDDRMEPKMYTLLGNSEFFNFMGRPIIFIKDGEEEGMMYSNFANDALLNSVKILVQGNNGMQIMMTKVETRPDAPTN